MDPILAAVLQLQECEARRMASEKELRGVPLEAEQIERARTQLNASIEAERAKLKDLELKAKQVEHGIRGLEERSAKLKGQQMQVKKNDEYQALGREIEGVAKEQGELEEQEIGMLYELDTARAALREAETKHKGAMAELEARVAKLRERERALKERHAGELAAVAAARSSVAPALLGSFERLMKAGRFPSVVALNGMSCTGCHMRVSNGIEQEVRKSASKLTACDNCGRLLYLAA